MSAFGETLFGNSRFIKWTLTPGIVIFAVAMPLLLDHWTPLRVALMAGMEMMCLALLAGFWLSARAGHFAFRLLCALVFLAYVAYLVCEFFFTATPLTFSRGQGERSPINALVGFVVIGIPCLMYAAFGRFTLRAISPAPEHLFEVRISDLEVVCIRPDGAMESLAWADLQKIEIVTTDEGPWLPDVFWVLHGSEGGCAVPNEATGFNELLTRLQKLSHFDNAKVIEALGSTVDNRFLIWQRSNG